jgi:hypothetical protein
MGCDAMTQGKWFSLFLKVKQPHTQHHIPQNWYLPKLLDKQEFWEPYSYKSFSVGGVGSD